MEEMQTKTLTGSRSLALLLRTTIIADGGLDSSSDSTRTLLQSNMANMEQDYEAIRQENIRKNAELMLSLGLNPVSTIASSVSPIGSPDR